MTKKKNKPKRARTSGLARRNTFFGYLFTTHWLAGFILFMAYPLGYSLYMAFHKVSITDVGIVTEFTGFHNISYAFTFDVKFINALIEAIRFVGIITPLVIILSLIIGMMLAQKIRLKGLFRAIYFFPVVIISGTLYTLLEQNEVFSLIDFTESGVLRWMYMTGFGAFAEVVSFLVNNIFTVLWFSGVQILIYLSGMQKVSPEIYEAASIDGASSWQVFWKITLPSMNQFTIINIVYTVVLLATFSTNTVIEQIRENMFGVQAHQGMGYASAVAWIYFVVIVLMLGAFLGLVAIRPSRKGARA